MIGTIKDTENMDNNVMMGLILKLWELASLSRFDTTYRYMGYPTFI
jgi:hypothetical protein